MGRERGRGGFVFVFLGAAAAWMFAAESTLWLPLRVACVFLSGSFVGKILACHSFTYSRVEAGGE